MKNILSKLATLLSVAILSACAAANPDTDELANLGDFSLGHNVAITTKAKKAGPSRTATPEEWEVAMEEAIAQRFGRYEGTKLYHLGISLEAYALAVPGIPVVVSPKSVMVINVNVWDDAKNEKLTKKPHTLTVFEQLDEKTVVGSGLTQTREEQMANLTANMAAAVERYLLANAEWFGDEASEDAIAAAEKDELKIPEGIDPTVDPTTNPGTIGTPDDALAEQLAQQEADATN